MGLLRRERSLWYAIVVKRHHIRRHRFGSSSHRQRPAIDHRKRLPKRRTKADATRGAVSRVPALPPGGQVIGKPEASYACGKCGFRPDVGDPDWFSPETPVWDPKGKKPQDCWSICPDDGGPDVGTLTSPDRRSQRYRFAFQSDGKLIRLCTPHIVVQRFEKGVIGLGFAMDSAQIWREFMLYKYLKAHGPDEDIDLQRLQDATSVMGSIEGGIRCHRTKDTWIASYVHSRLEDKWSKKARTLLVGRGPNDVWERLDDLVAALEPRHKLKKSMWNRIFYIPIDMSRPIDEQLEAVRPRLTGAREYLYRYTRHGPPRDRSRTVWRDVYVFLLVKICGKTVAQIGEEVFPAEDKRSREKKVRAILGRVRTLARKVDFPTTHAQLSPPAKFSTPS
jgi:hypothetical protein